MAPISRATAVLVMMAAVVVTVLAAAANAQLPGMEAILGMLAAAANGQAPATAPATSDGTSVDQGIAYVLMLVALVLTYLIHPLDAASAYKLF